MKQRIPEEAYPEEAPHVLCWYDESTATTLEADMIAGMFLGIGYFGLGGVCLYATHRLFGVLRIREITLLSAFYLAYFALIFVPAFGVSLGLDPDVRIRFLLGVASVPITVLMGALAVNAFTRFGPREITRFYDKPIEGFSPTIHFKVCYVLFLFAAVGLAGLHVAELPRIPLAALLSGVDARELVMARAETTKFFESSLQYAYLLTGNTLLPFLSLVALSTWIRTRRASWGLVYGGVTSVSALYMIVSIQRKPVFLLLAMSILLYYMVRRGRFRKPFYVLAPAGALALPYVVTLLRGTKSHLTGLARMWSVFYALVIHRLLVLPADVLSSYFAAFPTDHPFLFGRTMDFFARVTGEEWFSVPSYIAGLRSASYVTTHSNAAFLGFAYADFGMAGVLVSGFLVGILLQTVNVWVLRWRKSFLSLVLLAMLIASSMSLLTTALPTILISKGFVVSIVLVLIFRGAQFLFAEAVPVTEVVTPSRRGSLGE